MNFPAHAHALGNIAEKNMNAKLPESREKEIFLELLKCPSNGPIRADAQSAAAERHGISLDTVKAIERKGMAQDWPPLD